MVINRVWEPLDKKKLLEGAKVITSTWACKKKSYGTYCGQLNTREYEQVAGKHFDPTSTFAPVTNKAIIRIVLVLILLADCVERIYGIKGASLKGKFENGKKNYGNATRYGTPLLRFGSTDAIKAYTWFEDGYIFVLVKAVRNNEKYRAQTKHSWPMYVFLQGKKGELAIWLS